MSLHPSLGVELAQTEEWTPLVLTATTMHKKQGNKEMHILTLLDPLTLSRSRPCLSWHCPEPENKVPSLYSLHTKKEKHSVCTNCVRI